MINIFEWIEIDIEKNETGTNIHEEQEQIFTKEIMDMISMLP